MSREENDSDDDGLSPPPEGFSTWLDYAVFNMDTRSVWHEFLFSADPDLKNFNRDEIQRAAEQELRMLRARAGVPDTYPGERS
ncbi:MULTISPECIES: hypothetical protein [Paraburkholderia]|uniref:hypothetical protein n=1 Tax=Paraburkholderia TaxID=1822464 RepID=UPI0022546CDB|nr:MULTISPECIES: hypothetical protein [Paraburkholderia]MCX4164580.1 hypothetical protein [Paraburkholderia megapolitana]MDN7160073.1 hypothetical protein [Paraburkholderia sp. CHISQ3]MDQ6497120.1 hypothetical protein [Paraburkholderia megapolitana]